MKQIALYWAFWQHWTDLLNRDIFWDFDVKKINKEDGLYQTTTNWVIVPISETKELISKIILLDETKEVINFSGIMWTTPAYSKEWVIVSNLHFMFWPWRIEWLKLISSWNISSSTEKIIQNASKSWITHYNVKREQHDFWVAITQALTHLFIILSWLSDNKKLTQDWRAPIWTVKDMIFENGIFIKLFEDLLLQIKQKWDLSKIFIESVSKLTQKELEIFSTPNFNNVAMFFQNNKLLLNEQMLDFLENFSIELVINTIKKLRNIW